MPFEFVAKSALTHATSTGIAGLERVLLFTVQIRVTRGEAYGGLETPVGALKAVSAFVLPAVGGYTLVVIVNADAERGAIFDVGLNLAAQSFRATPVLVLFSDEIPVTHLEGAARFTDAHRQLLKEAIIVATSKNDGRQGEPCHVALHRFLRRRDAAASRTAAPKANP